MRSDLSTGLPVCVLCLLPLNVCLADVLDEHQEDIREFPVNPIGCEFIDSMIVTTPTDSVCAFLCRLQNTTQLTLDIDHLLNDQSCALPEENTLQCSVAVGDVVLARELEPVSGSEIYVPDAHVQEVFQTWSDGVTSCFGFVGATELRISEPLYQVDLNFQYSGDTLTGVLSLGWDDRSSSVILTVFKQLKRE